MNQVKSSKVISERKSKLKTDDKLNCWKSDGGTGKTVDAMGEEKVKSSNKGKKKFEKDEENTIKRLKIIIDAENENWK